MRVALAFGILLVALGASGCGDGGGDVTDTRSQVAKRLAGLCDTARADVEALGLPSEVGPSLIPKWAARGTKLVASIRQLRGATPAERRRLKTLAGSLGEYYRGLKLGAEVYKQTKSIDAYATSIDRAKAFLTRAEGVANRMGVPECARRPFDDAS